MANIQTTLPAARVPAVDDTGLFTREWFRYFSDLFTFTGIGQGAVVCGQFAATNTQTASANTPTAIVYDTTAVSQNVTLGTVTSRLNVLTTCLCSVTYSVAVANTSATADDVSAWIRVNGTDLPDTARIVTMPAQHSTIDGTAILVLTFFHQFTAGDYVEVVWMTATGTSKVVTTPTSASPARPVAPGAVVTINQIDMSAP